MSSQPLAPEQEAEAHALVARLRPHIEEDLLAVARFLVRKEDRDLFGETEFEVRDVVHRLGAKANSTHLAGKKRAAKVPASSARTAGKASSSTAIGPKAP